MVRDSDRDARRSRSRDDDDDRDDRQERGRDRERGRDKRSFEYKERTRDDVRERANASGGNFDKFIKPQYKRYKIKEGKNLIRILPPTWEDAKHYGFDLWVNYGVGADSQSYLSLAKMKGGKDPLADARREAEREGDEKTAKALQPRQRILSWVIDREDEEEGPQLFDAPFTVDKSFANLSFDEDTKEVVFIDDPKKGCDVRFYKEGTGLKTKYPGDKMRLMKSSLLHEDEDIAAEWLAYIQENPLPECIQFYDYDHIANSFNGHVRTDDDDDGDDKKERGKRARRDDDDEKPRAKARHKVDDDDDPPFEPDEKPKTRGRAKADDDDDDEDVKPRRSRPKLDDRDEAEDDDDEPKAKGKAKARSRDDDDDEADEKGVSESIRDRLRRRHSASKQRDEDDDD